MDSNRFNFPIPFDPFRLLLAGMEKLWLWLFAGILCAVAGAAVGALFLGNSYTAT